MVNLTSFFILLPLYIYPSGNAWSPLITAAKSHPHLSFRVIVNPDNGPGDTFYPDSLYIANIAALNNITNIFVYAYVHVSNGNRTFSDVTGDLDVYAGWRAYNDSAVTGVSPSPDISVDGVFFDECPVDVPGEIYMAELATYARTVLVKPGFKTRPGVIFNTGLTSDLPYYAYADYINSYEGPSPIVAGFDIALGKLETRYRRNSTVIVTGFEGTQKEQKAAVKVFVKEGVRGVFVTTREDYYGFSSMWTGFVNAVSQVLAGK